MSEQVRIVDRYGKPFPRKPRSLMPLFVGWAAVMLVFIAVVAIHTAHDVSQYGEPAVATFSLSSESEPELDESEVRKRLERHCASQGDTWPYDSPFWREEYEDCYERYGQVPPGDSL